MTEVTLASFYREVRTKVRTKLKSGEAHGVEPDTPWAAPWDCTSAADLKASPLPPAPYQQATAGSWSAEMGHFCMQNLYLGDLRLHFGILSDHFGDPGVHGDTQQAP